MNDLAIAWEQGVEDRLNPAPHGHPRFETNGGLDMAFWTGFLQADVWNSGELPVFPENPYDF